jgi:hypothetical protein
MQGNFWEVNSKLISGRPLKKMWYKWRTHPKLRFATIFLHPCEQENGTKSCKHIKAKAEKTLTDILLIPTEDWRIPPNPDDVGGIAHLSFPLLFLFPLFLPSEITPLEESMAVLRSTFGYHFPLYCSFPRNRKQVYFNHPKTCSRILQSPW